MKTPKTTPLPECRGGCVSRLSTPGSGISQLFTPSQYSQTLHNSHGKNGSSGKNGNGIGGSSDSSPRAPYRPGRPFWITSLIGFLFLTAAATHYFMLRNQLANLREQSANLTLRTKSIRNTLETAQTHLATLRAQTQTRTAVLDFAHNRVTWAPILTAIWECADTSALGFRTGDKSLPDPNAAKTAHSQMHLSSIECLCMGQDECILRIAGSLASTRPREDCDLFRSRLQTALTQLGIAPEGKFTCLKELLPPGNSNLEEIEYALEFTWTNHHR